MLPTEVIELFLDEPPIRFACRTYAAGCVAHRLMKFGWEPQVNELAPRELILLAHMLPEHARDAMMAESLRKAYATKDHPVIRYFGRWTVKKKGAA